VQFHKKEQKYEKVILVGVQLADESDNEFEESLKELDQLVYTAGGVVHHCFTQKREVPDVKTYMGKGKIEEISQYLQTNEIDLIVFDGELKPKQEQNIMTALNVRVIDRVGIILDIFASRAQTREARIEVECAQLEYLYPRLTHLWQHLERQEGNIGTRGPGETQLETDKRLVQSKIHQLKREIKAVVKHRAVLRSGRKRRGNKVVSIVGYTNAGKSTLLEALSKKDIYTEDKLFATLDPVIRKVYLSALGQEVLFSDTVGFIRKLPHSLVDSFKSTLEEVVHADLILHVSDSSNSDLDRQIEAVYDVLEELNCLDKQIITVLNKTDLLEDKECIDLLIDKYQPAIAVSAKEKNGLEDLMNMVSEVLSGV